ncbi:bifunctional 4-hydroxy-3-methylbut-2-enyl diphosphate reductase/30S ribosomal protein S1 [Phosphitispora fastidiosa]|uniref:bifunctional 4-hydroxy-3-methylbut-2-enyl diphosphate reductase/30S ribosomal protein S1 n=1 Tax=Phosphitispora fastidiosa TaxID=2837202 RepID=UPI001E54F6EF|nr:bifunctional 4-hydroxy-3-methylbut-2-enyl diphosphate reductase/30S ribosomal protein S1 [Phosphitispora fastidiosa]MBU7005272.1 4-hydroxy-3-methylbut-2-enyl diphosphate reductase [Phosphitispora fastidiosa]
MKTILAPKAGFCFGVKRALDLAMHTAQQEEKPIYTLGPLIHSPQVVEDLSQKGLKVVQDIEEIPEGVIIVRSHGVGPEVFERAKERGLKVIDATCPFVKKAQELAKKLNEQGYQVIVVGDKEHPEVTGILGWTGHQGIVAETPQQAENMPAQNKIGIISQTTQPEENFNKIVSVLQQKSDDTITYNTICHATRDRQDAAVELAKSVHVMIVVGGKNSANTQKLARLCADTGTPTYHIETAGEIDRKWLIGMELVGITAGASTPDWIIEEVRSYMEDVTNQENEKKQLEEALTVKELRKGDIVKGVVVQVGDDEVLVDVGGKSEGVIPMRECSCCDIRSPKDLFNVGDEVEVAVIRVQDDEGKILLSKRKADAEKAWDELVQAVDEKRIVEGVVMEVVKGGLLMDVGVQAFMPASLVERGYVEDLAKYVGERLQARVIEVRKESRKVILSRKAVVEEEYHKQRAALWDEIEEGQVRKGTVRRMTNFGAFVDLGGIDGLLHVSEMAWYRVGHPSEILKENDEIEVFVLGIDRENEKVSLSLKKIVPNPWDKIEHKYSQGQVVTGKVVRLVPFGAFVELEPGVDALVHISQLAHKRIGTPGEVVSVGEQVTAKVIEVDTEKHKISISIKELAEKEPEARQNEVTAENIVQEDVPAPTIGEGLDAETHKKLMAAIEEKPEEKPDEKPEEEAKTEQPESEDTEPTDTEPAE